ncbi:hypothetical protein [Paraburkholderia sp. GAS82]|uniref:hypothetical protein n=1 Tax=Paraburkholderia sp. GAS82 TaxID=3035137 RepID=UPI003D1F7058
MDNQIFYLLGVVIQFFFGMGFLYLARVAYKSAQDLSASGANRWVMLLSWILFLALGICGVALIVYGLLKLGDVPALKLPSQ